MSKAEKSHLAENLFAKKEGLLDISKTINNEIIAQMKSETADASKLEALLNKNIEKLRLKLGKFSNSFTEFHALLTPEQRSELVKKWKDAANIQIKEPIEGTGDGAGFNCLRSKRG